MIQEKDFLYRVPVKNALVTAPGKQVRNPEILVDLEGGEFMHGNILDANSTNKLIDQSVKDAIDNSIENSNCVTKDLLEAETNDLRTAISAKQDAGSYVPYDQTVTSRYRIDKDLMIDNSEGSAVLSTYNISAISNSNTEILINPDSIIMRDDDNTIILNRTGIILPDGDNNHVLTSNASTIDITQYALKTDLPAVPTNVSQLTNDSNFITQQDIDVKYALSATADSLSVGLSKKQDKITVNSVDVTDIETADITRLRTIVINLIDALSTSGLIRQNSNLE